MEWKEEVLVPIIQSSLKRTIILITPAILLFERNEKWSKRWPNCIEFTEEYVGVKNIVSAPRANKPPTWTWVRLTPPSGQCLVFVEVYLYPGETYDIIHFIFVELLIYHS